MVVGLAQLGIVWEDKKSNAEKVRSCFEKAAEKSVDMLLFPEMTLTGFSMNTIATADKEEETILFISDMCKEYGLTCGIGWVKCAGKLCENHYSIINQSGECLSDYIKLHPFSYSGEDEFFQGGEKLSFFSVQDFKISTAICYDLRFPEIFQIMSKQADMIVVPANWPAKRDKHWMALLQGRAIENQCYIVGVNCAGDIGGQFYEGNSNIFSPDGDMMAPISILNISDDEKNNCCDIIKIYDISNDVENIRNAFPVKKDRREELYKRL